MDKNQINEYIQKLEKLTLIEEQLEEGDFQLMKELENLIESLGKDVNSTINADVNKIQVKIKKLYPHAVIPKYAKPGDAGMDLVITNILKNTSKEIVYTFGIAIEIPTGYVGLIFPRSSVRNMDLTLANSVGVIDCVPKGTKIQTIKGEINVEDLFENPFIPIYSYNEELNKCEVDNITDMWIIENKELLKITTEDGDVVEIPFDKEVFTKSGWKKAKDLTKHDEILRFL